LLIDQQVLTFALGIEGAFLCYIVIMSGPKQPWREVGQPFKLREAAVALIVLQDEVPRVSMSSSIPNSQGDGN
jgi:hypothetical protein